MKINDLSSDKNYSGDVLISVYYTLTVYAFGIHATLLSTYIVERTSQGK